MKNFVLFLRDEKAATVIEYALIVALISIVGLIATQMAGGQLVTSYSTISSTLSSANR